ncbi:DUF108 domain-containing protein [Gordonia sp. ABSL11-1]|uniref:aspartate dehydrogenase domain-containing protein n=1 Tax=Gordonia sp. ABSL11-1 TaxID=3053924 RepID=UPI0025739820|nr:aspartate dehydrogenase domain-containing protein [Gordonia sp. ABSL11-1]MDL9947178.1 DUF108 domain-containing protein [Gordonia sp. ABSL11-1]
MTTFAHRPLARRVAVLGHGTIGSVVAAELMTGKVAGAELCGVICRRPHGDSTVPWTTLDDALHTADVIVECAGQQAVRDRAAAILEAGVDLVLTSVGALSDVDLRARLSAAGPGRMMITNGAIGGLDMLAAAHAAGGLDTVTLTSTKKPTSLLRPWMSADEKQRLTDASKPVRAFRGTPDEAARLFPESLNVALAVDLAAGGQGRTVVELIADPHTPMTRHAISADGAFGRYSMVFENRPSTDNPRSSAIVPYSVLQTIGSLVGRRPVSV